MSTGAYSLRPVLRAGVALLAVGLIHGVLAGEKVDFQKPSESPATKPGRRPLSLPDESSSSLFPRNGESAPFVSPAPQPSPPPVTRKSMEEQDRQKNWLLYEVGNMRRDTTAEQIFEVDTFGLPQDLRHHSVFERFVEGEQAASAGRQL